MFPRMGYMYLWNPPPPPPPDASQDGVQSGPPQAFPILVSATNCIVVVQIPADINKVVLGAASVWFVVRWFGAYSELASATNCFRCALLATFSILQAYEAFLEGG